MNNWTGFVVAFCFFLFGGINVAHADLFLMKNGDRIRGKLVKAEKGQMTVSTAYSGELKLAMSEVAKILTRKPVVVKLSGGRMAKGALHSQKDGRLALRLVKKSRRAYLNWEDIEAINPPPRTWDGDMSFGGSTQTGNTDRSSLSIGGDWKRRIGKLDRTSISFLFNFSKEDEETTAQNTFGSLKYDHFYNKKIYAYLSTTFLNDKFKDLNLRTVVGPGLGYLVWNDENGKTLDLEAGISYFSEDLIDDEDQKWATGRLAADLAFKVFKIFRFRNKLEVFPNLIEFGRYTSRNVASLTTALGNGWSFKLSNIWQYDSDPPDDVENSDVTTIYAIQYSF